MLARFQNNIIPYEGKRFLLAVSGGIDSVVMAELFRLSGEEYAIAHCNFQLRGKESDGDEKFVKELAKKSKVPFFSVRFDTKKYNEKHKLSLQMGARKLRYEWLEEKRLKNKFDYIVIAHNADDSIETFFINLLRGTGISGLHGIKAQNGNVIRPILNFYRRDIEKFALLHKLKWREDSSNETDNYERNKIRHHLLPALEEINPSAKVSIAETINNLQRTEQIYSSAIESNTSRFISTEGNRTLIHLDFFRYLEPATVYLFELIKKYGFNYEQCLLMAENKKSQPGKTFYSETHRLVFDREYIIIEPVNVKETRKVFEVEQELEELITGRNTYMFRKRDNGKSFKIPKTPDTATLDLNKLTFPLKIRKWEKGDRFYPLGMKKPKKISDFLIDNKVSLPDKEQVHVLTSGNEIVWVAGYRIDERFKVTVETERIYLCRLLSQDI